MYENPSYSLNKHDDILPALISKGPTMIIIIIQFLKFSHVILEASIVGHK